MTEISREKEIVICESGGIPETHHADFISSVRQSVSRYLSDKSGQSEQEAANEINSIGKLALSARKLVEHKRWRPTSFRQKLEYLEKLLKELSPEARNFLSYRRIRISLEEPESPDRFGFDAPVVNPIAYKVLDDQIHAVEQLYCACSGHGTTALIGAPKKLAERDLYLSIKITYEQLSDKKRLDGSVSLMAVLEAIAEAFKLENFHPESIEQQIGRDQAQEIKEQREDERKEIEEGFNPLPWIV